MINTSTNHQVLFSFMDFLKDSALRTVYLYLTQRQNEFLFDVSRAAQLYCANNNESIQELTCLAQTHNGYFYFKTYLIRLIIYPFWDRPKRHPPFSSKRPWCSFSPFNTLKFHRSLKFAERRPRLQFVSLPIWILTREVVPSTRSQGLA